MYSLLQLLVTFVMSTLCHELLQDGDLYALQYNVLTNSCDAIRHLLLVV